MTHNADQARRELIEMAVTTKCPRCKAAAGKSCEFGITISSPVHHSRITRALLGR